MDGDVKGVIPVSGDWCAVYAGEGDHWTVETQPVLFWAWVEKDGQADFVGVVEIGPTLVAATSPTLLGYARHDEDPKDKFQQALEAFKKEEAEGSVANLADKIRSPDAPCACVSTEAGCEACDGGKHDKCLIACSLPPVENSN